MIGIAFNEILVDTVERLPGDLGSPGIIKENGWTIQGGELASDLGKIERHWMYSEKGMGDRR